MNAWIVFLWGVLGAARLTRLVWADKIMNWLHDGVERRWRKLAGQLQAKLPDESKRPSVERAYKRWQWVGDLIGCYWCFGLWAFIAMAAASALVARFGHGAWMFLGGPWWWTLPCAALGTHWVYALITSHVDPAARDSGH